MPVRSCPFACRSGRPPAIPAPRTEPGSSPRQRLYNRHSQRSRARSRYPQAGFARKIHLDHRRGAKPGIVPGLRISVSWRCNHHLRKPVTSAAKLLSPAVDLAWADLRPARHFGDNRSRLQGLGDNRLLCSSVQRRRRSGPVITSTLAIAPPLTPVQAPSLALMLDYQPETVLRRKAALTGGKLIFWTIGFFSLARSPRKPRLPPAGVFFSHSVVLSPAGSPVEQRPYAGLMRPRPRGAR